MHFSTLLPLAALAGVGFCQSYTNFNEVLNTLPSCSHSCATQAFQSILESCGGTGANIECVCKGPGVTRSETKADGTAGAECVAQNCDSTDTTQFVQDIAELGLFCIKTYAGTTTNPSTSSSKLFLHQWRLDFPSRWLRTLTASNQGSNSSGSNPLFAPTLALILLGSALALMIWLTSALVSCFSLWF